MTRDPDLEQLRLDCLKLALAHQGAGAPLENAAAYFAFVTGQEAQTYVDEAGRAWPATRRPAVPQPERQRS